MSDSDEIPSYEIEVTPSSKDPQFIDDVDLDLDDLDNEDGTPGQTLVMADNVADWASKYVPQSRWAAVGLRATVVGLILLAVAITYGTLLLMVRYWLRQSWLTTCMFCLTAVVIELMAGIGVAWSMLHVCRKIAH